MYPKYLFLNPEKNTTHYLDKNLNYPLKNSSGSLWSREKGAVKLARKFPAKKKSETFSKNSHLSQK